MEKFNVLVADDEIDIYYVTKMVLANKEYKGKSINVMYCASGRETVRTLAERNDIKLLFLDIIMENEYAGFRVIDYIRNEKKDLDMQIIIRTGMSGTVPEEYLSLADGVNGYFKKTDITFNLLTDLVYSAVDSAVL